MNIETTLRSASRELRAPPGVRLRFLQELRADLEDLQASLRAAGVPEAEARRRAETLLAPDAETLAALSQMHRSLWVRLSQRAPSAGGRRLGVVLALLTLAGATLALRASASLADLTLFLVPIAGIAVAAVLQALVKAARIWLAGESESVHVRAGSGNLLVAAIGATVATTFGVVFELYRTASHIESVPSLQTQLVLELIQRTVTLVAAGVAVALPCGLAWLFFVRHAAGLERHERVLFGPDLRVHTARTTIWRQT